MSKAKPMSSGKTVREVCQAADLSDDAMALVDDGQEPREFVDALFAQEHYRDTVRFLAHALPKREGVWWVWWCAKTAAGTDAPAEILASLEATKKWIADPNDTNSHSAWELAEVADIATPAGCAGMAAFFSGTSVAPPNVDPVPPVDGASARAVAGGIMCAALMPDPREAGDKFKRYIEQGLEVTEKIKLWQAEPAKG